MSRSVVLVVLDSVRADRCGVYGHERATTPTLSGLDTIRFQSAYANAPYTPASMPSFLTSRYPLEQGHVVFNDYPTIPDYLSETDYMTAIAYNNAQITAWRYDEPFDTVRDFSTFDSSDAVDPGEDPGPVASVLGSLRSKVYTRLQRSKRLAAYAKDTYLRFGSEPNPNPPDQVVLSEAKRLSTELPEPYFLYVHLMDTHHPYVFEPEDFEAVSPFDYDEHRYRRLLSRAATHVDVGEFVWSLSAEQRDYLRAAYDASIRAVDRQLASFIENCDEETTVIVTSDHGEEFWERGHFGHGARPSKPREMTLHEEMVRVPLLVHGPDGVDTDITTSVSLVDLLPTILDIAGIERESDSIRGQSLLDHLEGEPESRDIVMHATSPGDPNGFYEDPEACYLAAIRSGDNKLHFHENEPPRVYDLSSDPDEHNDIEAANEQRVSTLKERLLDTIERNDVDTSDHRLDTDVESTLQELGYLE